MQNSRAGRSRGDSRPRLTTERSSPGIRADRVDARVREAERTPPKSHRSAHPLRDW